jgi:RNA-directed DNA polymerase
MPKTLFERLRSTAVLHSAWRHVRANGLASPSRDTRAEIRSFDADAPRLLRRIQAHLRSGKFQFDPQIGVLKTRPGKRPRPLVLGSARNRVVQRALLDVLQDQPTVKAILQTPTSFGGVGGRGRDHAIRAACRAIEDGATHFIRSDIKEFFTAIPRDVVFQTFEKLALDSELLDFVRKATQTELANLARLGPDAAHFPLYEWGVAQGCCLSPLMGNVLLEDFDSALNGRGVTCLRYIDDLLFLGPSEKSVTKAFESGRTMLLGFGLDLYLPEPGSTKAKAGLTRAGFDFLGCSVDPGLIQPSRDARDRLLKRVRSLLDEGRVSLRRVAEGGAAEDMQFAQTLVEIHKAVKGWGQSYWFCNAIGTMVDLDSKIDDEIEQFVGTYLALGRGASPAMHRRLLGVHLLSDQGTLGGRRRGRGNESDLGEREAAQVVP